ncbi:MAG TPA: hypothetical protein VGP44_01875, partial [Gemmatimonadales bacterium]|nr:hypothetical protein [Gemmatimonadales bacterium]
LWYDGLADRVDLRPMNREQIEEVLSHALDGTIPAGTIDTIWSASGGNPRILDALLHDAAERGELAKRNGIWMLLGALPADGPRLTEVVVKDMLRRSPEEQEVLKLVALAGPVSRKVIEDSFGAEVVRTLLDQQMIVESSGIPADLRIWNSVFGEALRTSISVSRSLQLLETIRDQLGTAPEGCEGRMRAVEWALECGLKISDPELLEAAGTALVHSRNRSSRTMAAKVTDPDLVPRAQAVHARALFNEGDFVGAAKLLDGCWLQLGNGAWAVPVFMLRAVAHQALGTPLAVFAADSRAALQGAGAMTAGPDAVPTDSQETPCAPARPWQECLLRLLELSEAGSHQALEAEVQELRSSRTGDATDYALRAVGLALLAHSLASAGRAVQGLDTALMAASELPSLQGGVFFFNEFVLGRLVADYLAMGEWDSAERELANYAAGQPRGVAYFGGSLEVLRGYSLLRQGRMERAYQTLLPAVETLRLNDPLQMFRFGSGLAFYVAARLGDAAQA